MARELDDHHSWVVWLPRENAVPRCKQAGTISRQISQLAVAFAWCLASPALGHTGEFEREALYNWHQWRGPLATGMAPHANPPIHWDAKTNIMWKAVVPGTGDASPIVWGDRVFVLSAVDTGRAADSGLLEEPKLPSTYRATTPATSHRFIVLCFDRQTGALRWQQTATEQIPHERHHLRGTHANASPTTDGRFVYASFGSRGVYCYDMDGHLQWKRDFGRMKTGGNGEAASPVIHGDALILNWDHEGESFLAVLDARTGRTRWKTERHESTTWATPVVTEYGGRTQVVVNGTKHVQAYDLATGQVLWKCAGLTTSAVPSPVVGSDLVICMTGYQAGATHAIRLSASGDITGKDQLAWDFAQGSYVPSPLLAGDRLYFNRHNAATLTVLDVRTGKALLDRQRLPQLTELYASPVGTADRIYFVDCHGTTVVIRRKDTLEVRAINRLDDWIEASPAIAGRQLFLRGQKFLYCLEEATP
jgi:outer membrane protein assembly factor BamB